MVCPSVTACDTSLQVDKRYGSKGLHANCVMPGVIFTPLARHLDPEMVKAFETPYYQKSKRMLNRVQQQLCGLLSAENVKERAGSTWRIAALVGLGRMGKGQLGTRLTHMMRQQPKSCGMCH